MADINIIKKDNGYDVVIAFKDDPEPIFVRIKDHECKNINERKDLLPIIKNKLIRRKELMISDGKVVRMELYEHLRKV